MREFKLEVHIKSKGQDFAPAGRDVYSNIALVGPRSVGAQQPGALANERISLLTERSI